MTMSHLLERWLPGRQGPWGRQAVDLLREGEASLWTVTDAQNEPVANPRRVLAERSADLVSYLQLFPEFLTSRGSR